MSSEDTVAKVKTSFICQQCGASSPATLGGVRVRRVELDDRDDRGTAGKRLRAAARRPAERRNR